ncbi:MAG: molybdenum cofactor biosynthesis protein MoaE [Polyangiales bacterium]|nr:molybdenum cofactor biosynthesis protein MoaE [Myxococcales bacterium]
MAIKVRYYAAARDLCGCSEESFQGEADRFSQAEFLSSIGARHPGFQEHAGRMRLAVNGDFAAPDSVIRDGDEVVVLPPVAGGRNEPLAAIRRAPLSVEEVMDAVRHPGAGAVTVFTGVIRNHSNGKSVSRIEYEAYEELAEKEMRRILERTMIESPGVLVAAAHRVGTLAVGDIAVVVTASASHRAEAFQACRTVIDRIKDTVPVWKKEWDTAGAADWVNLEV